MEVVEIVKMNEMELIKIITENHFTLSWSIDKGFLEDGAMELSAFAGDNNCSHQKEYDPEDGHGYTFLEIPQTQWGKPVKEQLQWIIDQGIEKGIINKEIKCH